MGLPPTTPRSLAKISEALECGTSESDVGAEIVYKMLGGRGRRRGDRALVVNRELDPQAWAEPIGRGGGPSRENHPACGVEVAIAEARKEFGGPIGLDYYIVVDKEDEVRCGFRNRAIAREAGTEARFEDAADAKR